MQPQPQPTRVAERQTRNRIDAQAALLSTLRSWLACRDALLMNFCPAANDAEEILVEIQLVAVQGDADRMNSLRAAALHFAGLLATRTRPAEVIVAETIASLLSTDSPVFSLAVDNIPGSF